jgi:hypothetical protein
LLRVCLVSTANKRADASSAAVAASVNTASEGSSVRPAVAAASAFTVGRSTVASPAEGMESVSMASKRVFVRFAEEAVFANTANAGATAKIVVVAAFALMAE